MAFHFKTTTVALGDSLEDMKKHPPISQDLIICDPPFNFDAEDVSPWIDEAVRMLKPSGNLVIFHFPSVIMDIDHYIQSRKFETSTWFANLSNGQSYKNISRYQPVNIQLNSAKILLNDFAQDTITLSFYSKGPSVRKFYANRDGIQGATALSTDALNLVGNFWNDKRHQPGFRKKIDGFMKSLCPEATPPWVIERLLYCCARKEYEDRVYDCFGGAGTVPFICAEYGIKCRSVEIDEDRYNTICERLNSGTRNKVFAGYSVTLTKKAQESGSINRTDHDLGSGVLGSIIDRGKDSKKKVLPK